MKRKLLFICMAICQNMFGQVDPRGYSMLLSLSNKGDSYYHIYQPYYQAKGGYKDTLEARNDTPEKLMSALISEKSDSWYKYNHIGGEANNIEYYEKMDQMDKEKNYFELHSKWSFKFQQNEYCIIKFYFISANSEPISGCYNLVKIGNRWKVNEVFYNPEISLLFLAFQDKKLQDLFRGKPNSNPLHNNLLAKVYDEGGLNLNRLFTEYELWQEDKKINEINYFLDSKSWINHSK